MYFSSFSRLRRAVAACAVLLCTGLTPVLNAGGATPAAAASVPSGYWMVASDGGIFAYGGAGFFGSTGAIRLNMPIVGMAATPSGQGYWLVASDGGIFSFGDAGFFGSTGAMKLNRPIVGMAATRSGRGYWLVASDGGIFAFGDASFHGSTGDIKLNKPISGMTPSASGQGYRMVASDGGIFSFGDAAFYGSAGGTALAKPIAGMAPTPSGKGYWLVGSDGKVFPYGDAAALGSATALKSVAAVAPTSTGNGYWAVGADGSLATFGDATDLGHPTGKLAKPIVGMATLPATTTGATPGTPGGPGVSPGTPGDPGTTPTTVPYTSDLSRLYVSHALEGSIGTRPQIQLDPSHPFRHVCEPWGTDNNHPNCHPTEDNAEYSEEIRAMALVGNRLFLGGFIHGLLDPTTGGKGTKIADEINYLVEVDAATGKLAADRTFMHNAAPNATVESMAVSPDGQTLYIGGRFTQAGGGPAPQIAALDLRTGLMVDSFKPSVSKNGSVHAIALSGGRLYIGGAFKSVDDKTQYNSVAALEAQTGKLIEGWVPPVFSGSFIDRQGTPTAGEGGAVDALAVIGQHLLVGGEWVHVGTDAPTADYDAHSGLTALNLSDGSRSTWRPHNDRPAFSMALFPDRSKVCVAVGGQGGGVACFGENEDEPIFNIGTPEAGENAHQVLDHHIAHVDGDALGVAITDNRIYIGGHFDVEEPDPDAKCLHTVPSECFPPYSQDSTPHRHLVAYDHNGKLDPAYTAQADTPEGVTTILAGPNALYVGGNMKHTLDQHPGAKCWPCSKPQWGAATLFFHPGFAIFPAVN
jgi:hypothetical protein